MFLGGDAGRGLLPRGLAGKFESLPDAGTTSSTTVAAGEVAGIDSSTSEASQSTGGNQRAWWRLTLQTRPNLRAHCCRSRLKSLRVQMWYVV